MSQSAIEEIELNIKEAKKLVDLGKSLDRLHSNRDFKRVIGEGFFKDEAVRLVHLKSDPAMQDADHQEAVTKQMDAIGGLVHYFRMVQHQSMLAAKAIEADEETRDELMAEELD